MSGLEPSPGLAGKPLTRPDSYGGDIQGTSVCGPCGDVVGPAEHLGASGHVMVQRGTCDRHAVAGEPLWPGYDYNRFVELCRCCGTVALRSGSRWSIWFCAPCREQVQLLNQRLGRYAIPVGRHSIHAARFLQPPRFPEALEVQIFLDAMGAAQQAMEVLERWARHIVRMDLRAIREDDDSVLPIWDYCAAAQKYVLPADRFREMCAWLTREGREARNGGGEP